MSKAAFLAASGLRLYTTALKQKELQQIFMALSGDPQPAFGFDAETAAKLTDIFADLWSKGHQAIAEQLVKALLERGDDRHDLQALEENFLRAAAVEMSKLSMHFKNTRGKYELYQSAAFFLYITRSMLSLNLVRLYRLDDPAGVERMEKGEQPDVAELVHKAEQIRANLNVTQEAEDIKNRTLPGLSLKQLEDLKNYDAKPKGLLAGLNSKTTILIAAAVIVVVFFML
ncbi:MAG: hypothetical protein IAB19_05780 [Proteobacteria bacterium]|uniref:Uncharacterized protein n=1 Tax=Candidatus Avisuccinivibrio stercorigallinarum TaxID=2840704 RepID=A0A9D9GU58_9GAMM|nr:hypothetical protein [Candidatus Avisuccinivibrio stercorigallinarum]